MTTFDYINSLKEASDSNEELVSQNLDSISKTIREFDRKSTEILREAKKAINEILNGRVENAEACLNSSIVKLEHLAQDIKTYKKSLGNSVSFSQIKISQFQNAKADSIDNLFESAKEECMEAKLLYVYLFNQRKIYHPKEKIFKDLECYIGGLCDMCGELLRKARLEIIESMGEKKNITNYYRDTKQIYDTVSLFAFTNKSGLRSKVEQLKGYINEFEKILYDICDKP